MSTPNPTHIDVIIEHRWRDGKGCNCTWFPDYRNTHKSGLEMHSEHVVSKLTDAGYNIVRRDALARAMYLNQARHHVHPDDSMSPEQSWDEGFFPRKSLWLDQADRILAAVAEGDTNG